jgi:UDP-N-acetylmuramoyl-L-alanyl-D-glutamate--2,6-diaminopimelate ligase
MLAGGGGLPMILKEMLKQLVYKCVQGEDSCSVTELVYDSRKTTKGCVFVCISGAVYDGHAYAKEVAEQGAAAIIVEKDVEVPSPITVIQVEDTRVALAYMSATYFGHPARKLKTIGITGTKGKTTTTYMIKSILENTGRKVGLIGTIETIIGDTVIPANNTTPESYTLQETFARMVEEGCECVVMEVSSQGLKLNRVAGFTFDYGIFTNLGEDHIGGAEHTDFQDYLTSKSKLFKQCRLGLINIDDEHAEQILEGHTCKVETFGFAERADIRATQVKLLQKPGFLGISYQVQGLMNLAVEMNIPGKFNVYNSLCAISLCRHFGVSNEEIIKALANVYIKGRVELVPVSRSFSVMLDYAHNAMSLESLLTTLKEYNPKRLVCVFGCGGNRSRSRRFEMGEVSSNLADLTIVTSDNPRFEEPQDIVNDIIEGVKRGPGKYVEIIDRKEAIRYSIEHANEGDVIVVAGKGHEDYQEIKGVKYPMDDRILIRDVVAESKLTII